ncbi:MAG: hypothetical protein JWN98_2754 [Abditibacteriota bacterium]|nr:hypothetical protein [Abditibacteriota bacterium]
MNGFTIEQAMALVEVRELLRLRDIDVDAMSDEEIIGFVHRGVQWIADMFPCHHPSLSIVQHMAQARSAPITDAADEADSPEERSPTDE